MSSLPVLAEAGSKLHADIAIIRLLRAGIRSANISAVFPRGRAPNTVCCWLSNFHRVPIAASMPIAAAGLLGRLFRKGLPSARSENSDQQLEKLGFTADLTTRLIEKMQDGRIVLCVHARNEAEAMMAYRIFQRVAAENITCPVDHGDRLPPEVPALSPHLGGVAA